MILKDWTRIEKIALANTMLGVTAISVSIFGIAVAISARKETPLTAAVTQPPAVPSSESRNISVANSIPSALNEAVSNSNKINPATNVSLSNGNLTLSNSNVNGLANANAATNNANQNSQPSPTPVKNQNSAETRPSSTLTNQIIANAYRISNINVSSNTSNQNSKITNSNSVSTLPHYSITPNVDVIPRYMPYESRTSVISASAMPSPIFAKEPPSVLNVSLFGAAFKVEILADNYYRAVFLVNDERYLSQTFKLSYLMGIVILLIIIRLVNYFIS